MIAYVGIDAHTTNYTLATRMEGSKEPINVNTYSPAVSNIVKYCKAIRKEYGKDTEIVLGYEAGCLGFKLRRDLEQNDLKCIILAPTSIPGTNHLFLSISCQLALCRISASSPRKAFPASALPCS